MSYAQAMEAAGATVLAFEQFGCYQGDWFALVDYNGERGWVQGGYGSCSGCDAFEAEFGWYEDRCKDHTYSGTDAEIAACSACAAAQADYARRLADFGRTYLDGLLTQEQAEAHASQNLDWDSDAPAMVEWVKKHAEMAAGKPA